MRIKRACPAKGGSGQPRLRRRGAFGAAHPLPRPLMSLTQKKPYRESLKLAAPDHSPLSAMWRRSAVTLKVKSRTKKFTPTPAKI